jgi:hypothetical protein
MIITRKVDVLSYSVDKNHITKALDKPFEVYLIENKNDWIGLTD